MIQKSGRDAMRCLRILVSGSLDSAYAPAELNAALRTLTDSVLTQLAIAGMEGVVVDATTSTDASRDLVKMHDGLVVLGGCDIHPRMYGRAIESSCSYGMNPIADEFEISLIRSAIESKLPVFGICRGMQLLNVALGGALIQDLGPNTLHNTTANNSVMTSHSVRILRDTNLASIFGDRDIEIRSAHHQAIDSLGSGLIVSAVAPDRVIEAIELTGEAWGVGVQWHPEDLLADPTQIGMLFAAYSQQCLAHTKR